MVPKLRETTSAPFRIGLNPSQTRQCNHRLLAFSIAIVSVITAFGFVIIDPMRAMCGNVAAAALVTRCLNQGQRRTAITRRKCLEMKTERFEYELLDHLRPCAKLPCVLAFEQTSSS
jgi:hypothetical protein